jgi:type II secretory pathway component PulF
MKADDLIALNDEISAMARAGLPLDQGLAALAREMDGDDRTLCWGLRITGLGILLLDALLSAFMSPDALWGPGVHLFIALAGLSLIVVSFKYRASPGRLRAVTAELAEDLRLGKTLPEALERQGNRVPPFYASLVTAGIRTGRIGEVLATLTSYARSMANLRGIIIDALFYPAVVLGIAVGLVGFLLIHVVPRFDDIYRDFNMKLPALTEAMITLGRHPIQLFVLPVGGLILCLLALRAGMGLSGTGRRTWTRMVYTIPLVGTMMRSARLAAFTDLLSILVDQGVPLTESFHLAGEASSDPLLTHLSQKVRGALNQGQPLGEVLRGQGLVPEWVAWMAGLGEQRGQLAQALKQIAEMYRRQVEIRAGLIRSVLPPFLVIITAGFFVASIVLALMLPMIKLLEGLSK